MLSNFLTKEQVKVLRENYNFDITDYQTIGITEICSMIPSTIKIDDTEYYWRLVRLNKNMWDLSYMRLNYNGDKDSQNKTPILHSEIDVNIINVLFKMLIWTIDENYFIDSENNLYKKNKYIK